MNEVFLTALASLVSVVVTAAGGAVFGWARTERVERRQRMELLDRTVLELGTVAAQTRENTRAIGELERRLSRRRSRGDDDL